MEAVCVSITPNQVKFVEAIAREKQITFSDALRRVLEMAMEK